MSTAKKKKSSSIPKAQIRSKGTKSEYQKDVETQIKKEIKESKEYAASEKAQKAYKAVQIAAGQIHDLAVKLGVKDFLFIGKFDGDPDRLNGPLYFHGPNTNIISALGFIEFQKTGWLAPLQHSIIVPLQRQAAMEMAEELHKTFHSTEENS